MLDLNHYRAPSRVWEWVENNWLIRSLYANKIEG